MIKITSYAEESRKVEIYRAYFQMLDGVLPFSADELREAAKNMAQQAGIWDSGLITNEDVQIKPRRSWTEKTAQDAMVTIKDNDSRLYSFLTSGIDTTAHFVNPQKLAELLSFDPFVGACNGRFWFGRKGEDRRKPGGITKFLHCTDGAEKLLLSRRRMNQWLLERTLPGKMRNVSTSAPNPLLSEVFRYELMTESSDTRLRKVYAFTKALNVNVCPYCNRNYTFTIYRNGKNQFRTRPELDHFLPKSIFPFLSLSLKNLVPSCHTCNLAKHDNAKMTLYPYAEGAGNDYRFFAEPARKGLLADALMSGEQLHIKGENLAKNPGKKNRIDNSAQSFGWTEIYAEHTDLVRQVFRQRYIFNDACLDDILTGTTLFSSRQELRNLLYLRSIDQDQWANSPMAKLIHDMDLQYTEEEQKNH